MLKIIAKPSDSKLLEPTKARLSLALQDQLQVFKTTPTSEGLDLFRKRAQFILAPSITRIMLEGYSLGAKQVDYLEDNAIALSIKRLAIQKAQEATTQISNSSSRSLGIEAAISSKRFASKARANLIAEDQLSDSFFFGILMGWSLFPGARKAWNVHDAHDLDDTCDDNEAAGFIPIKRAFPSGHLCPKAHIGCNCFIILGKPSRKT